MEFTPIILIHMLSATGAAAIGGITLSLRKGTATHRLFGRVWVTLMVTAALVSFGIKSSENFSWIHLLSVGMLLALGTAVLAAVKGRIKAHQRGMISTYIGLVVAGAFTFLPSRRLGYLVWHSIGLI